jgi:Flp pilus assembly protein TadB
MAFTAGACAVAGIYSILLDLFLRDRTRFDQRLEDAFRTRARAKTRKAPLFKDLEDLKGRVMAEDLANLRLRQRLEFMVEQSGLNVTPDRLLAIAAAVGLGLGAVAGLLRQSVLAGVFVGLIAACGPVLYVHMKRRARLNKLMAQLPDAFDLMARVIRAGQTMSQALQAVADEFDPPIAGEFAYCYEQQNMGLSPDLALRDLARRSGILEIKIFVLALLVQQQTGGNLAEVLEKLAAVVRDRFRMVGKIKALTAEGRLQAVVLMGLIPFVFFALLILDRSYVQLLLDRPMLLIVTFTVLILMLVSGRRSRIDARLDNVSGKGTGTPDRDTVVQFARSALPAIGASLVPTKEEERSRLQARLMHAGLYSRQAMVLFLGVKLLLILAPAFLGLALGFLGMVPTREGVLVGACLCIVGMIGPSFWLDFRKRARQTRFRRALPDALDVLVICLEGGLSFPGALRRVASELETAHPLLAAELNIAQRQIQLGRSSGEALRQFGDRADLEEIRGLASIVIQAERFGASLVNALRVHAETLRIKRMHQAEEMAQKAVIKVLFPTMVCIFPGLFVVILGPGVIRLMETFGNLGK